MMAVYKEAEDLINIGAYKTGSNPKIDQAIKMEGAIEHLLRQDVLEHATLEEAEQMMMQLG
jgi:flagellum-specific ATP synthase